ncbi:hypothetical protein GN956_G20560 [Arapaima gigas]
MWRGNERLVQEEGGRKHCWQTAAERPVSMARVLCNRAKVLSQLPGIQGLLGRLGGTRGFAAADSSGSDEPYVTVTSHNGGSRTVWPDETMGPFGPQDQRFQLPGNVGFDCHLERGLDVGKGPAHITVPDLLSAPSSSERHEFVLAQFIAEFQGKEVPPYTQKVSKAEVYFNNSNVECAIQPCPELLKQDFELVFPEAPATSMTVVTVTQRTQHDTDRELLLDKFVSGAKEICYALRTAGFWADFIDPSSGLAFFGSSAKGSVLETDEQRYVVGFLIEDLGCCKVIRQALLEKHQLVGTVLTNAPPHSSVMKKLRGK